MDASTLLEPFKIVPVVVLNDVDTATKLGDCLLDAGIGCIEITLRSPAALACIEKLASARPEMIVGAGSIRTPENFTQIKNAGAQFAVSPGATDTLIDAANVPYLPGIATASESIRLLERGYRLQKFFPAESLGGVNTLKSLSAPLPEARFCPTGGLNEAKARAYLALSCVACVGGSWFVPSPMLAEQDFAGIGELARSAMQLAS